MWMSQSLRSSVTSEKLCKNIVLKLQATYVLDICDNRLSEAILTNIQNIMFYEEIIIKQGPFLHIILSIKDSLQQQVHFNGNTFGNKCCRCNKSSL